MRNWLARALSGEKAAQDGQALYTLGQTQVASGQLKAAIETFRRALTVDGSDVPARLALANLLSATGERHAALTELETALRLKPQDLQARLMRGQIEATMGRTTEAVRTLLECVERSPNNADAWNVLADCYFNIGDGLTKAEHAYRSALACSPSTFAAFRGLGECLARQRRLDKAQSAHEAWFGTWIENAASEDLRRRQDDARGRGIPAILLVAMQKSASEYIRENLKRTLDIPEIYISIGTIPCDKVIPSAVRQLAKGGAIARSHMDGADFAALAVNGITRIMLDVRDPRQVTISWAHMMRGLSDVEFRYAAKMYDPSAPDDFREWPLHRQLDWAVDNYMPGQVTWLESWAAVLDKAASIPVCVLRFEEFRHDEDAFFRKISDFYGIAPIDRPQPSEQSAAAMRNFRRGDADEWRSVLTPEQLKPFNSRLKPLADRFGWEF
jgi:tetratricopeptide (TPR) repeat protein